jgi:hypothetical protein
MVYGQIFKALTKARMCGLAFEKSLMVFIFPFKYSGVFQSASVQNCGKGPLKIKSDMPIADGELIGGKVKCLRV